MREALNKHPVIINYLQVDALNQISEDTDVLLWLYAKNKSGLEQLVPQLYFCVLLLCMKNYLKSEKD